MLEVLLCMMMGKTVAIADTVDVSDRLEFSLAQPISAISGSANLQLDVSHRVNVDQSPEKVFAQVAEAFPAGSVIGQLSDAVGRHSVALKYLGGATLDRRNVRLILQAEEPINLEWRFSVVRLEVSRPIGQTTIYWQNCKL
ncbi:hypothetical protein [Dokdonella sp.]|uniref:hypothetical protein n=1 Tax=Dokdonella sp. TaxID=2291710 RepID=UPI002C81D60C|nr:hypothetical protein [Dokdonella sp.]HPN80661.1 hypothetical protein [Dokdonella sp.]